MNEIRRALMDPTPKAQEKRQEIAKNAAFIQGCSGLAMGGLGCITAVACLSMQSFPVIGGLFALVGTLGTVAAHEGMVLSRNVVEITKGDGPVGNVFGRANAAFSAEKFTEAMTKDTWVAGPLFRSAIEQNLKNAEK